MKAKSFLFSMLAAAALVGCSSDDVLEEVGGGQVSADNKAYVAIRLCNPSGTSSRGTAGNPEFQNGTAAENEVKTADFYFYNENGKLFKKASKILNWNNSNSSGNVEKIADATIVLEGLKSNERPNKLLVVLNGIDLGNVSLTDAEKKAKELYDPATIGKNGFVMTNSTTKNGIAVKLVKENFLQQEPTKDQLTNDNAVTVYVERLAAKVNLTTTLFNNGGKYKIGQYEVNGVSKDIKIEFTGWGLSATTKDSHAFKQIDDKWNLNWNWDASATNYRTYWGKSTNYDQVGTYPTTANNVAGSTLNYAKAKELKGKLDEPLYCYENTNTPAKLKDNFFNKVTHVLLRAKAYVGDGTAAEAADLVRYQGTLYDKDNFFNTVLNTLDLKNYYKEKSEPGASVTTYKSFSREDIVLKSIGDGKVEVVLAEAAAKTKWYTGIFNAQDNTLSELTDETKYVTDRVATLKAVAEYYMGGDMYYHIPIEHLGGGKYNYNDTGTLEENGFIVNEGDYGVVRNHYYNISVNSIKNLGNAIYNPDEHIVIPTTEPSYYVGAKINILSWKVVNQNVDL